MDNHYHVADAERNEMARQDQLFAEVADPIVTTLLRVSRFRNTTTRTKVLALRPVAAQMEVILEALLAGRELPATKGTPRTDRDTTGLEDLIESLRDQLAEAVRRAEAAEARADDVQSKLTAANDARRTAEGKLSAAEQRARDAEGKLSAADKRATDAERDRDTKVAAADKRARDAETDRTNKVKAAETDRDNKVRDAQTAQRAAERQLRTLDRVTGPLNAITDDAARDALLQEVIAAANGDISMAEQQRLADLVRTYRTALRDIAAGVLNQTTMFANKVRSWIQPSTVQVLRDVLSQGTPPAGSGS